MSTTDGPASRGRPSPVATAIPYILSRLSFLSGIVLGAWTMNLWVFLVGGALGLLFAGLDRLVTRAAHFDDEIDVALAWPRAEDARTVARESSPSA